MVGFFNEEKLRFLPGIFRVLILMNRWYLVLIQFIRLEYDDKYSFQLDQRMNTLPAFNVNK